MQSGGCDKHTSRAALRARAVRRRATSNSSPPTSSTAGRRRRCFPAPRSRSFGSRSQVGFIGMTLKETGDAGHSRRSRRPDLRRRGRDRQRAGPAAEGRGRRRDRRADPPGRLHQGRLQRQSCPGIDGDILPILARLDPAIDLVVSGHTHRAYRLRAAAPASGRPLPADQRRPLRHAGHRHPPDLRPGGQAGHGQAAPTIHRPGRGLRRPRGASPLDSSFPGLSRPIPAVKALVDRYVAAAEPEAARVVGRLAGTGDARAKTPTREHSARRPDRRRAARRRAARAAARRSPS